MRSRGSHAWEGSSGMTGSRMAGSLIMAAGASLLGYWLYRLAAGQNQSTGRQMRSRGDERIPDVGKLAHFGPLRPTGQTQARQPEAGQSVIRETEAGQTETGKTVKQALEAGDAGIRERRFAAFSDPEKAPVETGSCYGAVRHAGPENMRDSNRRPWDKVDEGADESFPASDPSSYSPGST